MLILLLYGLPALALLGFGIWALRRETAVSVRAVGYLLAALGTALLLVALLSTLELGMSGLLW